MNIFWKSLACLWGKIRFIYYALQKKVENKSSQIYKLKIFDGHIKFENEKLRKKRK